MNPVSRNESERWKSAGEAAGGETCRGKAQWDMDTVRETAQDSPKGCSSELNLESQELLHCAQVTAKRAKQC